jgi:hypothetical protein
MRLLLGQSTSNTSVHVHGGQSAPVDLSRLDYTELCLLKRLQAKAQGEPMAVVPVENLLPVNSPGLVL